MMPLKARIGLRIDNCSHEETDNPRHADRRNLYKLENGAGMGSASRNCCLLGIVPSKLLAVVPLADFIIFRNYVSLTEGMQEPA